MVALVRQLHRVHAFRPDCALINPCAHNSDLFRTQRLAFRGHPHVRALQSRDELNHQTLGAFAGNNRWSVFAAFERRALHVPAQLSFLFFLAVTFVAILREQRLDVLDEINLAGGGWRKFGGTQRDGERAHNEQQQPELSTFHEWRSE